VFRKLEGGSVKQFFADGTTAVPEDSGYSPEPDPRTQDPSPADSAPAPDVTLRRARIAIYDDAASAPRVIDVEAPSVGSFVEDTVTASYEAAREAGGDVPYTVVREVVENFMHADFSEPVVSVLDGGSTLRFADQGPGIPDKARAALPGFTTATASMKRYIRGVGSGLPIVQEYLAHRGGSLEIEDNLGHGTVITLRTRPPERTIASAPSPTSSPSPVGEPGRLDLSSAAGAAGSSRLSTRQKRVLSLILEVGPAGPTLVSQELSVGLSTAHRDLAHLESLGLITSDDGGKRLLTPAGAECLDDLFG
jgi:hypothetical protein